MSITYGFYNSLNGDRKYNAEQMSAIFDGIISDGVFSATVALGSDFTNQTFATSPSSGMTVSVGTGKAWFNHTWTINSTAYLLTLEDAPKVTKRIDAVVLEINRSEATRANSIKVVTGTPASSPVKPTMEDSDDVHQYPLAYISIGTESDMEEGITTAMIENVVGTSECPFCSGLLTQVNVDALFTQWDGNFDTWLSNFTNNADLWNQSFRSKNTTWANNLQSDTETWVDEFKTDNQTDVDTKLDDWQTQYEAWFKDLQDTLDADVAANLNVKINNKITLDGETLVVS